MSLGRTFETLGHTHQTVWRHMPEDANFQYFMLVLKWLFLSFPFCCHRNVQLYVAVKNESSVVELTDKLVFLQS